MDRKDKAQVRDISKKITQGIRDSKRSQRHEKVQNILEEFKGIRSIAGFKTRRRNICITHMRNKSGNIVATMKGIAKAFAKFYKDLSARNNSKRKDEKDSEARPENTCDHADDDLEDDEQDRHIP